METRFLDPTANEIHLFINIIIRYPRIGTSNVGILPVVHGPLVVNGFFPRGPQKDEKIVIIVSDFMYLGLYKNIYQPIKLQLLNFYWQSNK